MIILRQGFESASRSFGVEQISSLISSGAMPSDFTRHAGSLYYFCARNTARTGAFEDLRQLEDDCHDGGYTRY